jgi:ADP-heptose:LPS heptosyltransferase
MFTNEWVRLPVPWLNRVDRNLHLAAALGATGDEIDMRLPEGSEEAREADALLARLSPQGRPVVLISPGTSHRQSYKMWPPDSYARVASRLERTLGVVPVVSWGPGEEGLAAAVVDGSNGSALMAPSIGLRLLAGLLRRSALFIGADTGPMHLAWGVGCPVVAVFGPTDPRLNAPLGRDDVVLRSSDSTETVTTDQVLAAAGRVLARRDDRGATRRSPRLSRAALFSPGGGSIA